MIKDSTINKQILAEYVEAQFSGNSLGPSQQDRYKFSTGSSFVKIREPFAVNQTAESLYRTSRDNYRYLEQTEHEVVNQNSTILEIFDESVAVIFQPKLQELEENRVKEAADYYLDVAEDNILLDPKFGNLGARSNSHKIEYLDTSDSSSVQIPSGESFGSISNFGQDQVDFELLMSAHLRGSTDSDLEPDFEEVLEERASERYNQSHRLHP